MAISDSATQRESQEPHLKAGSCNVVLGSLCHLSSCQICL